MVDNPSSPKEAIDASCLLMHVLELLNSHWELVEASCPPWEVVHALCSPQEMVGKALSPWKEIGGPSSRLDITSLDGGDENDPIEGAFL